MDDLSRQRLLFGLALFGLPLVLAAVAGVLLQQPRAALLVLLVFAAPMALGLWAILRRDRPH
ncbi:MAG: hypothetical protein RMM31_03740 [Anaerolineae bacterium]|nr:hypothetical protein [Thermoflexales bacterium]MDW8395335.1 hypothetical protein [Anaerolineae bacterium]